MQLAKLKAWFSRQNLKRDLQLNEWTYIPDLEATINSYITLFEGLKKKGLTKSKKEAYRSYYEQLNEIKNAVENEKSNNN